MVYFPTKFRASNSNVSLIICIRLKVKEELIMATMLLVYNTQKCPPVALCSSRSETSCQ